MRKILLLIPVVFALVVSGCTAYDPKEIVRQSVEKLEALESYTASYDLSLAMYGFSMEGRMDLYKKGDRTRVDTGLAMMGEGMVSSTYSLPSGIYTCTGLDGNVTCIKGGEQAMASPQESLGMTMEMIEKGVISLVFNNIASIIGRSCYNITSNFTISKLGELEPETLAGLGINEDALSSLEAFTRFDITYCYDFETGMPLIMSMIFEIDTSMQQGMAGGRMNMLIEMTAKSYEPNAVIEDSIFELPAEPITFPLASLQLVYSDCSNGNVSLGVRNVGGSDVTPNVMRTTPNIATITTISPASIKPSYRGIIYDENCGEGNMCIYNVTAGEQTFEVYAQC